MRLLLLCLVVLLHRLEIGLRMQTCGACLRSIFSLDDETAVAALPPNLSITVEEIAISNAAQQLQVATLVLGLYLGNVLKCGSHSEEALLFGYLGKLGIHLRPLLLLAHSGS